MARTLPLGNLAEAISEPSQPLAGAVTVYDPAMCCSTGLCGPGVDPALLGVARDLRCLEKQGVTVERFGLSQQPDAFVRQPRVTGLIQAFGDNALPATLVNGEVLVYGRYPSREEIVAALSANASPQSETSGAGDGGCGCGPGSTCR